MTIPSEVAGWVLDTPAVLAYARSEDTFLDAVIAAAGRRGLTLVLSGAVLDEA